jgi:serine/threonine-protein kinase
MLELRPGIVLHETYELVEVLGRGGMGEVWRARHLRLPKLVALKVLSATAQSNPEAVARFRREAQIVSHLGHPSIVEIFDFNTLPDGREYIVMELLQGEDLRRRLGRGAMPREDALSVIVQVASALQVAHRAGVVHRDLKPENIFLCHTEGVLARELRAKILDFGISKIQGSQTLVTRDHSVLGTPAYMSPEQAKGDNAQVDGRTDQFALATIAYEMLTGRCAFAGETLPEVIFKVVVQPTPPLGDLDPAVPAHMVNAINRGMAKEPGERFPDLAAFVSMLMGGTPSSPEVALSETLVPPAAAHPSAGSRLPRGPTQGFGGGQPFEATLLPPALGEGAPANLGQSATMLGPYAANATTLPPLNGHAAAQPSASLRQGQGDLARGATLVGPPGGADRDEPAIPSVMGKTGPGSAAPLIPTCAEAAAPRPAGTGTRWLLVGLVAAVTASVSLGLGLFLRGAPSQNGEEERKGARVAKTHHPPHPARVAARGDTTARTLPSPHSATEGGGQPSATPDKDGGALLSASRRDHGLTFHRPGKKNVSAEKPKPREQADTLLPPNVAQDLEDAEDALARGEFDLTISRARRTLREKRTARAFVLIAKAWCGKRDAPQAMGALNFVPRGNQRAVRVYCNEKGLFLTP